MKKINITIISLALGFVLVGCSTPEETNVSEQFSGTTC